MLLLRRLQRHPVTATPIFLQSFSTATTSEPSTAVPLALIKSLRAQTGAPITAIKSALLEHDNDPERTIDALRKRGAELSLKRAARETHEGLVGTAVAPCGSLGALVELRCETDFVARTERFNALLRALCDTALSFGPGDATDALQGDAGTAASLADAIGALGEGVKIGRARVLTAGDDGRVFAYAHGGASAGRIGALVGVRGVGADIVADVGIRVAMHVAAAAPLVVRRDMLSAEEIARERGVLRDTAMEQGKTGPVVEKIVGGRMQKWFSEVCLMEQEMLVERVGYEGKARSVADSVSADARTKATIVGFERFAIG